MENPSDAAPPLVAAPRHLRRRRLHGEIPDTLLVPGVQPFPLASEGNKPGTALTRNPNRPKSQRPAAAWAKRKRTAALIMVIVVSFSIAALVLALVLFD